MRSKLIFCFLGTCTLLAACEKHQENRSKIQPAKVEKSSISDFPAKVILTDEARNRLGIESRSYPKDSAGRQVIPVSSLLYDIKGNAWVFVETIASEFHREQVRVLETQNSQIYIISTFEESIPIVSKGAAELIGTESGVGK